MKKFKFKYARQISPPKGIFDLGGYGGGGEGVGEGAYFFSNIFYEFCILTGNQKSEFKSDIPDTCLRIGSIHLTIISHQCCVLIILMQEIFPKEKGNCITLIHVMLNMISI